VKRWAIGTLEPLHAAGNTAFALAQLALGGFVPVIARWLDGRITSWADVLRTLGGVPITSALKIADSAYGPALARSDAPGLFDEVLRASRQLGVKPPDQIRLAYVPCCGIITSGKPPQRALLLGLPLLDVLTIAELRAVLVHELTHLTRGDALRISRAARFLTLLEQSLEDPPTGTQPRGLLAAWSRWIRNRGNRWLEPLAHQLELRADRAAAACAGESAATAALVKVAAVQPLFREVLDHYSPDHSPHGTLYQHFRAFWNRLPQALIDSLRHSILAAPGTPLHPAVPDRLAAIHAAANSAETSKADRQPAATLFGDLESLEQMMHNRLFDLRDLGPTVFHRAGS
jgi:Zn-dependent protease with chaperone function